MTRRQDRLRALSRRKAVQAIECIHVQLLGAYERVSIRFREVTPAQVGLQALRRRRADVRVASRRIVQQIRRRSIT